jgi:hypothetical protein
VATPTEQVIEKLSMFGVKCKEIVQAQRLAFLASGQVDEGFCKGVCVDWARRVLQGGHPSFEKPGITRAEGDTTALRRQTLRQATIQLNVGSKRLVASTREERRVAVHRQLRDIYNSNLSRRTVPIPPELITAVTEFFTFTDRPAEYDMTRVSNWLDRLRTPAPGGSNEVSWQAFARLMDEDRRSNRPFQGIRIIASTPREPYGSAQAAINALLAVGDFTAGRVMIAGFGLRLQNGSDSGHAVAMHKLNTGKFMFLDPNYGLFEYTESSLKRALMYLFGAARTWQSGGPTAARPIYGEDGDTVTNAASYMIFGV